MHIHIKHRTDFRYVSSPCSPAPTPPPEPLGSPKVKPPGCEDTVQSSYLPQKSFPEKPPVNGTAAPPSSSSYTRYNIPKPYTTSARPFERKFDSPKFNHNLLPNDTTVKVPSSSPAKTLTQATNQDGGIDSFSRGPKYHNNNINAMPKAIPVRWNTQETRGGGVSLCSIIPIECLL